MCTAFLPRVLPLVLYAVLVGSIAGCQSVSSPTGSETTVGITGPPQSADPDAVPPADPLVADTFIVDALPPDLPVEGLEPLTGPVQFELRRMRCGPGCYMLAMRTSYDLPCVNYVIVQQTRSGGRRIQVDIAGVAMNGEECLTALGPATAETWMPMLTPGRYQLHFTYRSQRDRYQLVVNEAYDVEVVTKRSEFTIPPESERPRLRDARRWDSCTPDEPLDPFPPDGIEPLTGNIRFGLEPTFCGPGVFGLHMVTDYELPCINYWIANRVRVNGHSVRVEVAGLSLRGGCLRAVGPANADVLLPPLSPGRYQLQFVYGRQHDHYQLEIDEMGVNITEKKASFTVPY